MMDIPTLIQYLKSPDVVSKVAQKFNANVLDIPKIIPNIIKARSVRPK